MTRLLFVAGAIVVACGGVEGSAWAASGATSQNITVTPSSAELSAAPGGSTANSFSVINGGDSAYDLAVSVMPYHVEGTGYDPQFTPLPGTTDASEWVHIAGPRTQTLAARKLVNVDYTLNVPAGTAPGGYYAVLFAGTTPTVASSTGVVSHSRVGEILYITVQGAVKTGGNLQATNIPHISTASSLPLGMLVSNTGGVHFLTKASVTIKSIFGSTVFDAGLQRYVLPQTVRNINVIWNNTPPIGLYQVERSATVAGADTRLPSEWLFVVHPWVIVAFVLVVLVIFGRAAFKRERTAKTPK